MNGILFGIISAFCFGISNAYWKTASKETDFPHLVIFRGVIASVFFGILWFASVHFHFENIVTSATVKDYLNAIAVCIVCSLGLIFFLSSLKFQPVSITIPLTSVNIFNILTTVFIVGEAFQFVYYISFALALAGILLLQNFTFNLQTNHWNKGASYALLASFFWGITYPLFKFVSPAIGAIPLSFILETCVTCSAIVWALSKSKNAVISKYLKPKLFKHYLILATLLIGGTLFFNLAIQNISVLSLNILSNLQIVVAVSIGLWVYKETVNRKQITGIILILLSFLIIQFFT